MRFDRHFRAGVPLAREKNVVRRTRKPHETVENDRIVHRVRCYRQHTIHHAKVKR